MPNRAQVLKWLLDTRCERIPKAAKWLLRRAIRAVVMAVCLAKHTRLRHWQRTLSWVAVYEDGTACSDYEQLDRTRAFDFCLVRKGKTLVTVRPDEDEQLAYRMRCERVAVALSGRSFLQAVAHVIVLRRADGERGWWLSAYGDVKGFEAFDATHPWLYPITYRPDEAILA